MKRFQTAFRLRQSLSDAEIISESLADGEAFVTIYDRHAKRIHAYMHRRFPTALAEDLAAETFATAFACRSGYDINRPDAAPWLFGIAGNIASHHWREEAVRLRSLARLEANESLVAEGAEAAGSQLTETTAGALLALSAEHREAICLLAWGELTYDEIAVALAVPVGTVRSRIARARAGLKGSLEHATTAVADNGGVRV